ncbi:MAG: DNA polymerase III subunit gamma/tau [Agarilytica sp.]
MSYQVLARKWRPRIFREMVGQEHVLKALINALDHNRLHHAYLFTGTRGVGKTTIARILAKCLNCEAGVSSTPCGECSACNEIAEGRFVDLIEVDAASRTKVEDTRELLDNVQYAPTRGRYKIYLIDEVHMLSNHSFNALLKTLEEPPEHVKFLLATTDPQKLPVTILSRCLQFNLKNMSPERIVDHLKHVLTSEVIPYEEAALWLLARSADGSMRDALSLTDQAIAFGGGNVQDTEVATMLGTIDHVLIEEIMSALVAADGPSILAAVAKFAEHAPDYDAALADLLTLLHRIAIAQALPEALDNSYGDREQILKFATTLTPEDVQMFYQTALIGRRDLSLASEPRMGLEMTLLRMLAFKPQGLVDVPTASLSKTSEALPLESGDSGGVSSQNHAPIPAPSVEHAAPVQATAEPAPNYESTSAPPQEYSPQDIPVPPSEFPNEEGNTAKKPITETGAIASEAPVSETTLAPTVSADVSVEQERGGVPASLISAIESVVPPRKNDETAPVAKATSVVTEEVKPEVKPDAVEEPELTHQKIVLSDFTPADWIAVYHQVGIKGIVQSTAANSVMVGREENHIQLILDQDKTSLFDPSHGQRIGDVLSDYFGHPVRVEIALSGIPSGMETPAQYDERIRQQKHAQALETLKNDPVVQTLEREFGATLQEGTVKYPS